jgi:hypothetical protein
MLGRVGVGGCSRFGQAATARQELVEDVLLACRCVEVQVQAGSDES